MGILKNDGDIIIDVVLTDTGRERLARGDGQFQIVKFSLGDDEINYELYNKNHSSGSAYYDLEILQSPVLEAFTDNGAALKHNLVTIPRQDLLYLPILKLNEVYDPATARRASGGSIGAFVVAVNKTTEDLFKPDNGIMYGENPDAGGARVRVDQGLDTTEISPTRLLDDGLVETRYIVEIDHRLGSIVSKNGKTKAVPSYIDDDHIASYNFSLGTDINFVTENSVRDTSEGQVVSGPRGTILEFKILASLDLNTSAYFFDQLGADVDMTDKDASTDTMDYIDTIVRVTGAKTGRTLDVPVRYIRDQ